MGDSKRASTISVVRKARRDAGALGERFDDVALREWWCDERSSASASRKSAGLTFGGHMAEALRVGDISSSRGHAEMVGCSSKLAPSRARRRCCRTPWVALLLANPMDHTAQPAVHAIGIEARVPHLRYDDRRGRNGEREALDSPTPAERPGSPHVIEKQSGRERDKVGRACDGQCGAEARHHRDDGSREAQRSQRFVDGASRATSA